jgi:ribosome maturation factor RimP
MIPRSFLEKFIEKEVYIYVKHQTREFAGIIQSINEDDILVLADKYNNLVYIPISEIDVITERR